MPAASVAAADPYVPPPAPKINDQVAAERKASRGIASALGANGTILTSPRGVNPVATPTRGSLLGL